MSITSRIKRIYISASTFAIILVILIFSSFEIAELSKIQRLHFQLTKNSISTLLGEDIHKIESGAKIDTFYQYYKNGKLISQNTNFSNAKISIEPIFSKIKEIKHYDLYTTKSNERWIIIKKQIENEVYIGIINLTEKVKENKYNEIGKYKLHISKNKDIDNVLIDDIHYKFMTILQVEGLNIGIYDSGNNFEYLDSVYVTNILFSIILIFIVFFVLIFHLLKIEKTGPFYQFSSDFFNLVRLRIVSKKSISNNKNLEMTKTIYSIQNKIKNNSSEDLDKYYNLDHFIMETKIIGTSIPTVIFFSVRIHNENNLFRSVSVFFSELKDRLMEKSIDIDKLLISQNLLTISSFLPLSTEDCQCVQNEIVQQLSSIYKIGRIETKDVKYYKFNPLRIDFLKAYQIVSECCLASINDSIINTGTYHQTLRIKESIIKNEVSTKIVFRPIVSKRRSIIAAEVKIIILSNDKEISKDYFYETIKHEDLNHNLMEDVFLALKSVNQNLSIAKLKPIEFIIEIDHQVLFSDDFHENFMQLKDKHDIQISRAIFIVKSEDIYNRLDHVILIIKKTGIKVAIKNDYSLITIDEEKLKLISTIIFDFSKRDHRENIKMLSPFYLANNIKVLASNFGPTLLNKFINDSSIDLLSSEFIKPTMNAKSLIETIKNETRVIAISNKSNY